MFVSRRNIGYCKFIWWYPIFLRENNVFSVRKRGLCVNYQGSSNTFYYASARFLLVVFMRLCKKEKQLSFCHFDRAKRREISNTDDEIPPFGSETKFAARRGQRQ